MSKKGGFQELLFSTIMPKIYGIGAAIVIVGAMFKISHWPGATAMLVIGLTTEAVIFFLSSFEPKHKEIDWAKVYPELADDYDGPVAAPRKVTSGNNSTGVAAGMDKMLADAKVGPELIKSLGDGMRNLSDSAKKMSELGDAALATNEYAKNVKTASGTLVEMNKSYASSMEGMKSMTEAAKDTKEYHTQVQNVTKSLGALNAVYEMELKDAQGHVKSMNKFYSNLTQALESMGDAGKETTAFQAELNQLTTNIASLNKVYGNMLSAMKQG
ncbi:MAG: gliding motility protein GldL [Flammeovirgaceae bacterium]|nr:gliding motility protein GldL [Flammeovirgaceae bacterium]MBE63907.1 gliding motility protein GldL [Flammeovirgaceae bacterium]HCX23460.1 gliding motility protein GldL [Cytophagales bacterium]|tara:strand:- start:8175 stop:8987 length:813 start_codon:yes stop_codon:yes gene_type:complete